MAAYKRQSLKLRRSKTFSTSAVTSLESPSPSPYINLMTDPANKHRKVSQESTLSVREWTLSSPRVHSLITPKGKSPDHLSVPEEEVTSKAMDCAETPTTLEPLEVTIPEALSAPVSPLVTDSVSPFSHRGQRAREYKSIQQNRGAKVFANYKAAVLGRQESQGSLLSGKGTIRK